MTRTLMPPDASDDYAAYPKSIHSSLRNGNYKKKIPNTQKKEHDPNTYATSADSTNDVDNNDAYPYSLLNRKNKKKNMTPYTESP